MIDVLEACLGLPRGIWYTIHVSTNLPRLPCSGPVSSSWPFIVIKDAGYRLKYPDEGTKHHWTQPAFMSYRR